MKNLHSFLRYAIFLAVMVVWTMLAKAQHPFTLTTPDDVTNHTETLYWIESFGATGFYMIPHTDNSSVSTTNMPNLKALWYFMDAGSDSKAQYYYIVNPNTGYYLKLDGTLGGDNTIKIASFGSGGDAFKFSITGSEGQWIFHPKSGSSYWVNKKSGNVAYDRYLKSSNYGGSPDANSKWKFVAENSVTWAHPFTNSDNSESNYYLINNATSKGSAYYISTDDASAPYATISNVDNDKRIWYFIEAASDNTIPNLKYYYIVNAVTGKYLKFIGTANGNSQASSLQIYEHTGSETGETENRFQFMVLNAIGTSYSAYSIMPKLEISYYYNQNTSLSPSDNYNNSLSNNMKIGIYNDRGTDSNYAHWLFEETSYVPVTVEAPTVTNNFDGTITLSTTTPNATIYYTTNGDTPDNNSNEYTEPFSVGDATVIKAIAYLGSDFSDVSTYNVPKYTSPTISFDDNTSLVTISSEGTVYYNTGDGSQDDPTPYTGTLYSVPFELSSATTVKAIATHAGYLTSDVATLTIDQNHDYSQDYLTFRILTDGTICWKAFGSGYVRTIEYSINNGSWTSIESTSDGATFEVSENDVVRFRGSNNTYAGSKSNYSGFEGGTATFDIEGNIHSLLYGDDFANNNSLTNSTYQFCSLFKKSLVISAENLILPATTLKTYCYRALFSWCTTLTIPPALPATTLAQGCYWYMFEKCAITTAPELNATTLVNECYGHMFEGCSNLNEIKCLASTGFGSSSCLADWVKSVSESGTFVKEIDVAWSSGASGIPSGWDIYDAEIEDPVINFDGDFLTITCQTYGASIYYRLGETGDYSLYSAPIVINESTMVEAYAVKSESQSNVVSEYCNALKKFAGMKMTPGPLFYGSNGYEIKDGWNYNSYNSVYGKTVGSTYFNFIELGQLFESSVFSTSDGDIEKVLDPLDGWRVPTNAEWASIIGTSRSGSTVNETPDMHYAMIQLTSVSGLLIFPDGETITGVALANMDNTTPNDITESDLNEYLGQGCVFLPGSGYYNGSWNDGNYYWSSTENDSSTGYVSSGDNKNKESCYLPVYLVKGAADEATRLLRTWTYNNNEVELPYSVNAIDGHSASYATGTFNFTTDIKVKKLQPTYLWFQHADQSAAVYVNNTFVEKHWGGYNAFFIDITDYVHLGTNNIKVAIKNNEGTKLAPCAGDFNFNATLGEVKLISSPVVPSPDYGYDGFHITSTVTAEEATITVKTSVPTEATVTCSINGTNCDYSSTQTETGEITFTKTITNPHLWNGTIDPYLYDVTLTIAKDGVVYHKFQRGYGLRFYEYVVDNVTPANSRFMLNGSPYLLRGVCMHNDLEGKANALTAADMDNDFEILKELGCNFVRLAHYPHPKEVYDWCDKMGIIVQTEVPWVNNANTTQPADYYNHLEDQYRDMVNQHFNHPCIMFWGLSNETTTENTTESKNTIKAKIENYRNIIKGLDPERWVGYVMSHSVDNPSGYYNDPNADWFGCNIYVGWYIDKNSNNPTNRLNTRLNNTLTRVGKPLAFSEYGCGGTIHCHSDNPQSTTEKGNYPRHDIEYQMWLHEGHIAAIKNKPELLFTSQWQLFDIAVYNRVEGYKVCKDGETTSVYDNDELKRLNNKGLVERDHKTKKDTYYLYKAWWNQTDKFVHICGKDYHKLTDRVIKCYTNDGSTLTLYVNDVESGTATVTNNIATFEARDFNPGDVVKVTGDSSNDSFTITNYNIFTTEGNWNEASNWSAGAVPAAGTDVDILANATVPSDYTANVGNVTLFGNTTTLTIADGGQLVSNSAVNATVQKNITAYTISQNQGELLTNGWYFIASPITDGYTPAGSMIANTYDLYRLNNTTWENFKNTTAHPDFTTLNNGTGYLYANSGDVTLQFTGALKPYAASESVSVSTGWNLIGNPFAYNVYSNRSFYKMNEEKNGVEAVSAYSTNPIAPCTGIVVKAESDGDVIISKEAPEQSQGNNGSLQIALSQPVTEPVERDGVSTNSTTFIDNAIVSFNNGDHLDKFYFGAQNANIYIPQGSEEYAIVSANAKGEMTINFKAHENGIYTLIVNSENAKMSYLHLIDNITDTDVDLLQTPEYTFNAMTTDYESRFKLLFVRWNVNDDNETFAYINNGNIIITADVEDATLQVIDVMGRVILCKDARPCVSTNRMAPGTYILRLINSEKVMTQKIVIR